MPGLRALRWLAELEDERERGAPSARRAGRRRRTGRGSSRRCAPAISARARRWSTQRRVRRHGGERRAGAGAHARARCAADARRAAARPLRHRRRRAGARLSRGCSRACARWSTRCARTPCSRRQLEAAGVTRPRATRARRASSTRTRSATERGQRFAPTRSSSAPAASAGGSPMPGFELTATHSDAWSLTSVPPSMLVHRRRRDRRAGRVGVQRLRHARASCSRRARASSPTEDEDVSAAVAEAFRARASRCTRPSASIEAFEKTRRRRADGLRARTARASSAEAALVVAAVGWIGEHGRPRPRRRPASRPTRAASSRVDEHLRTTAPHVFAAGDVTGRLMLVPQALQDGFVAATNAVRGADGDDRATW